MHELGHGGFNMPHVGPSYSQRDDPEFGMTLMGSGNYTYGKTPTFLHETSAATLNTCQLAALTTGTFYTEISSTTAHVPEVIIDGGQCTVKGQASSLYNIEDVVVRFYNSTETFLGGSSGYTSVAFRAKTLYNGSNYNYEVTFPIEELRTVNSTSMRLGVTALPANGNRYSNTPETVYQLVNNGGEYTLTVK